MNRSPVERADRIAHIILVLLALVALVLIAAPQVNAETNDGHCPNHNGHPAKVESQVDGDLNDIVPPAGAYFCVKGSVNATGYLTADGTTTLFDYLGNGHDVSYWIHYGGSIPPMETTTPEPTASPSPSEAPQGPPSCDSSPEVYAECWALANPPQPTPAAVIQEDDPEWDCQTMGNRVCGPAPAVERPVALPDTAMAQP